MAAGAEGKAVKLINTDGLVLLGPGSEWFWTAVSGIVLAVTFLAIYRQLRLQRNQAAIEQIRSIRAEWASKAERHARLVALIDLEHWAVADGMPPSAYAVANWFDRLGFLVQKGHLDIDAASVIFAEDLLFWWTLLAPYVRQDRARIGIEAILGGFEFLAKEMGRLWKAETGNAYAVRETIADQIASYTELLRRHEDIERGVIPERHVAPTTSAQEPIADAPVSS